MHETRTNEMRQILIAHGFEPEIEKLGDMGLDELRYRAKGLAGLNLTESHRIPRAGRATCPRHPIVGRPGDTCSVFGCGEPLSDLDLPVVYRRVQHAAHGATTAEGWDLEEWDAIQLSYSDPRPSAVPHDAKKSHGYLDNAERQHVIYTRRVAFTGTCEKDERGMCVLFAKKVLA